jgi:hypothetical protein
MIRVYKKIKFIIPYAGQEFYRCKIVWKILAIINPRILTLISFRSFYKRPGKYSNILIIGCIPYDTYLFYTFNIGVRYLSLDLDPFLSRIQIPIFCLILRIFPFYKPNIFLNAAEAI